PPVDFVALVAGWLDGQLGEAGGVGAEAASSEPEPLYRVWMAERRPPVDFLLRWPGRWVAEEEGPSARTEERVWRLAGERLVPEASSSPNGGDEGRRLPPAQSIGRAAGSWCPFGYGGDLPVDQAEDDRRSLTWESEPLAERTEVLGAPEVELRLAVDRPAALIAARLVDVAPDGSAARITYGLLNLAHREGHETPRPLVPGEPFAARLALRHVGWAVPAGHRLRLAVSTAYWPIAWPSPEPVTLTAWGGELRVPVRPPRAADDLLPPLPPWPEEAIEPSPDPERDPAGFGCEHDAATGEVCHHWRHGFAADGSPEMGEIAGIGLEVGHAMGETARVRDDDPLSAEVEIEHRMRLRRPGWEVRIDTRTRMTATVDCFRLETRLVAREGERLAAERSWDRRIPRRLV
ncbi:MAG TPA: CocE/NonD family hydrolase C-terminal non-catalytic domain-containing protein, partial [Thermoanaerobaculia bacterium]